MGRALLAGGLLLGGCATNSYAPAPTVGQLAGAESSVKAARDAATAPADPKATRHLRAAEEQLTLAKQRAAAGDNASAQMLLARADADADLGLVLSRAAKAKAEASMTESQLEEARSSQPARTGAAPSTPSVPAASPGLPTSPSLPNAPATPTPPATTTP